MTHIIIKSTKGIYHRLDRNLYEVSMKTGKQLRYGLGFTSIDDIEKRGFKIVNEVPADRTYRFGYCGE